MTARRLHRVLAAAALALCGNVARAELACAAVTHGAAELWQGGTRVEAPAQLADCTGLRVERGSATICVQDRRERLDCRSLRAGTTLDPSRFAPGSGRGWLEALSSMLRGDVGRASAVTRGESADAGLPEGPVLLLGGPLRPADLRPPLAAGESVRFEEADSGRLVATLHTTDRAGISPKAFAAGRSYVWRLQGADAAREGRFNIVAGPDADLARRQPGAAPAGRTPAQALALAVWLQEQGFAWDARDMLRRAGVGGR